MTTSTQLSGPLSETAAADRERTSRGRVPEHLSRPLAVGLALGLGLVTLGATGGAIAAVQIGSGQIADNTVRSRDVRDGSIKLRDLAPGAQTAMSGATGARGPAGADGEAGAPGSDGVDDVATLVGPVASILGNSSSYVFAGPAAQVTTTASHPRVTGTATAPMGLLSGSPQHSDVGVCYQPSSGGVLTNFVGTNFSTSYFTTQRATYAAAATKVLPAGTFNVGMCVRNNGGSAINNNNYVNGWVMVTS